jgi:hypothetical protein
MRKWRLFILFTLTYSIIGLAKNDPLVISFSTGINTPGFIYHDKFIGNTYEISIGLRRMGKNSHIGFEPTIGLLQIRYRHKFDYNLYLVHHQTGISLQVPALIEMGDHLYARVGISFFVPLSKRIEVREDRSGISFFYSNNGIRAGYHVHPVQAGALLGLDWNLGKKKKATFGLRIVQMANGPVKEDYFFQDANIQTSRISKKIKPMQVNFAMGFKLN